MRNVRGRPANRGLRSCLAGILAAVVLAPGAEGAEGTAPPAADAIAINVLLEPDQALVAAATAANARLRAAGSGGFALDSTHVPHVTVLQCYVRRRDLDAATAAIRTVVTRSQIVGRELAASGLYATTFAGLGMVSMRVEPVPALPGLQAELIRVVTPYAVRGTAAAFYAGERGGAVNDATVEYVARFVEDSSGSRYRPHVTIGVAPLAAAREFAAAPFTPLRFRVSAVALYQLGNFGTARLRLWTSAESVAGTDLYPDARSPAPAGDSRAE